MAGATLQHPAGTNLPVAQGGPDKAGVTASPARAGLSAAPKPISPSTGPQVTSDDILESPFAAAAGVIMPASMAGVKVDPDPSSGQSRASSTRGTPTRRDSKASMPAGGAGQEH